uniref:Uncharacterized protein n=1 Tax=Mus spicilegus TaxID=10103 RepID=A0A8C6MSJ5_MUSSI
MAEVHNCITSMKSIVLSEVKECMPYDNKSTNYHCPAWQPSTVSGPHFAFLKYRKDTIVSPIGLLQNFHDECFECSGPQHCCQVTINNDPEIFRYYFPPATYIETERETEIETEIETERETERERERDGFFLKNMLDFLAVKSLLVCWKDIKCCHRIRLLLER